MFTNGLMYFAQASMVQKKVLKVGQVNEIISIVKNGICNFAILKIKFVLIEFILR
jgi:hypothetical protein